MEIDRLLEGLELLVPIAKTIPVFGTIIEGSLEATAKLIKYAQEVKANKEEARELAEEAARWIHTIVTELQQASDDVLPSVRRSVEELYKTLVDIADKMQRRAMRSKITAILNKSKDAQELRGLRAQLKEVFERFLTAAQIRTQIALTTLVRGQAMVVSSAEHGVLSVLAPTHAARYDSKDAPPGCLANTRIKLLNTLDSWATQSSSTLSIFWLTGLGGTGKTTIAKTLCDQLAASQKLAATFFASRTSAERRDPFKIIHTFAYELAVFQQRAVRERVLTAIQTPPEVTERSMKEQIERLIARPLANGKLRISPGSVFSIDALDECDVLDGLEGGQLIPLLADALHKFDVKLFVTSRHETTLQRMFQSLQHVSVRLHEIEADDIAQDVRVFFQDSFNVIRTRFNILEADWPSEGDIKLLTERTGYLFIFAATVVRFVQDTAFNPRKRLQQVLDCGPVVSTSPYELVDKLYSHTLEVAVRISTGDEAVLCERLRAVLGAVLVFEDPQPATVISGLLGLDAYETQAILDRLSAVLLQSPRHAVRIFHPSFPEFLKDPGRCKTEKFLIELGAHHLVLARGCLQVLNRQLRRDICNIGDPSLFNCEVPGLQQRIQTDGSDTQLAQLLADFCQTHLLHWLEVLSLLEILPLAPRRVRQISTWCKDFIVSERGRFMVAVLEDVRSTVHSFLIPIQASALHVYYSALVFMPRCLLYDTYRNSADAASICRLLTPRRSHWESTSTMLEGHGKEVSHIAFSADGASIASSSYDRTTRVWDVSTGQQRNLLRHDYAMSMGLAFPSDDACVFLATETSGGRSLRPEVQSVTSGKALSNRKIDFQVSSGVKANCIASDGVRISILGGDVSPGNHTVQIWDAVSGKKLFVLEGHSAPVTHSMFSPDDRYIATGASRPDTTLRVWDAGYGKAIAVREHKDIVHAVAFSADSSRIASACNNLVYVWDTRADPNEAVLAMLTSHIIPDRVTVDAVTFVSTRVAAGYSDGSVWVWDTDTASAIWVLRAHTAGISALAATIDGARIASASKDCTVRIWGVEDQHEHFERTGAGEDEVLSEPITFVAISPTGTHVIAALAKSIEVWDATTGKRVHVSKTPGATMIAFSLDGSRFLSLHELETDGIKVRLWDTRTLKCICELEPNAPYAQTLHYPRFSSDGTTISMSQHGAATTTWLAGKDFPAFVSDKGARVPDRNIGCAPIEPEAGWLHFVDLPRDPAAGMPRRLVWVPPEYRWSAEKPRDHIASAAGLNVAMGGVGGMLAIVDCSEFRKFPDTVTLT